MQLEMFDSFSTDEIVNVAKVKFRSPFRYPGGKTWLVPQVYKWMLSLDFKPIKFIEPFTGGGIVGLSIAFENFAEKTVLVELDSGVASVWETMISDKAEWLAKEILEFSLTSENVNKLLGNKYQQLHKRAFQTIVKNRVNRGGILADGAGRIKFGEKGKGIKSRWYPKTLSNRIMDIYSIRDRIEFINGDGIKVIQECAGSKDSVFFIDPPYTAGAKKAGNRLYNHSKIDHKNLFEIVSKVEGDFLMTYSNDIAVKRLAEEFDFDIEPIAMKNTHHAKMTELLIGRNLDWVRHKK